MPPESPDAAFFERCLSSFDHCIDRHFFALKVDIRELAAQLNTTLIKAALALQIPLLVSLAFYARHHAILVRPPPIRQVVLQARGDRFLASARANILTAMSWRGFETARTSGTTCCHSKAMGNINTQSITNI